MNKVALCLVSLSLLAVAAPVQASPTAHQAFEIAPVALAEQGVLVAAGNNSRFSFWPKRDTPKDRRSMSQKMADKMEHGRRVKKSKKQRREQERRAKEEKTPIGSRQTIKTNRQAHLQHRRTIRPSEVFLADGLIRSSRSDSRIRHLAFRPKNLAGFVLLKINARFQHPPTVQTHCTG